MSWEQLQPERHGYVDGEVHAVVGARAWRNIIAGDADVWLRQRSRGKRCRVGIHDHTLPVSGSGAHFCPDLMVTCDPRDHRGDDDHSIRHPWLVVAVLSDSTAAFGRGRKVEVYRGIDALTHCLLIDQLGQPWPGASLCEDVDCTQVGGSGAVPPPLPDAAR